MERKPLIRIRIFKSTFNCLYSKKQQPSQKKKGGKKGEKREKKEEKKGEKDGSKYLIVDAKKESTNNT